MHARRYTRPTHTHTAHRNALHIHTQKMYIFFFCFKTSTIMIAGPDLRHSIGRMIHDKSRTLHQHRQGCCQNETACEHCVCFHLGLLATGEVALGIRVTYTFSRNFKLSRSAAGCKTQNADAAQCGNSIDGGGGGALRRLHVSAACDRETVGARKPWCHFAASVSQVSYLVFIFYVA